MPVQPHTVPRDHTVTPLANGGWVHKDQRGNPVELHNSETAARFGSNGRPREFDVHRGDLHQTFHEGPGGIRAFQTERRVPGGFARANVYGAHRGWVEGPDPNHRGFERRTYLVGNRQYAVLMREHRYHDLAFYRPVPALYYGPRYYGWATSPWQAPISIQVGFVSQPWYTAYPGAFVPYGEYARPDQWMTDQILASNMQAAYEAGRESQAQAQGAQAMLSAPPEITPELKSQIDAQVRYDIQEQGQQVQQGIGKVLPPDLPEGATEAEELPDSLKPYHMVFRVVAPLTVQVDGQDCTLSPDAWVVRTSNLNPDNTVSVKVSTSRANDCPKAAQTQVTLSELQSMENEMDQQIATALEQASKSMGKNGMPAGPDPGATMVAGAQVQPDANAGKTLQQAQQESVAAEQQVTAAARAGGS